MDTWHRIVPEWERMQRGLSQTEHAPASPAAGTRAKASSLARDLRHRLDEILKQKSIREVANDLGMNAETVRRALQGESRPSVEFVMAVCSTYNVSAHWLLFGEGPRASDEVSGARSHRLSQVEADLQAKGRQLGVMLRELELLLRRYHTSLPSAIQAKNVIHAEEVEIKVAPDPAYRPRGSGRIGCHPGKE